MSSRPAPKSANACVLALTAAGLLSLWAAAGGFAATLPTPPQVFIDTTYSAPAGNTIRHHRAAGRRHVRRPVHAAEQDHRNRLDLHPVEQLFHPPRPRQTGEPGERGQHAENRHDVWRRYHHQDRRQLAPLQICWG